MPSFTPLFSNLLSEGWFASVVGTYEDRVTVTCSIFSRDYDEETGHTDIVFGDTEESGSLYCVGKFNGVFELRSHGPAALLHQPLPPAWGYKDMPREMANAIAALITPANFPEAAKFMVTVEEEYPEDEDAKLAFWASVNERVSSMTAAGDPWGALKVQREAVNKLINWVDPPPDDHDSIPELNVDETGAPPCLLEMVYGDDERSEEDDNEYLPIGAHLLPLDFQAFLRRWNQTIASSAGEWIGEARRAYKEQNPELWKEFRAEMKRFNALYPKEIEAVEAYQASPEGKAAAEV